MIWNRKRMASWTTWLTLAATALLLYWFFTFMTVEVFGLKVFAENLSELFAFSIFGILAVMAGALILNLCLNLSRIADSLEGEALRRGAEAAPVPSAAARQRWRWLAWGLLAIFPLTAALLWTGDRLTVQKKQRQLEETVAAVTELYERELQALAPLRLDREYLERARRTLLLVDAAQDDLPTTTLIQPALHDGKTVYVAFTSSSSVPSRRGAVVTIDAPMEIADAEVVGTTNAPGAPGAPGAPIATPPANEAVPLEDYLRAISQDDRNYLDAVFAGSETEPLFRADDGRYELYYPVPGPDGPVVLYFRHFQYYGKIGS